MASPRYLSCGHRDDVAGGCSVAALAGEAARGSPTEQATLAKGVERMIARVAAARPGETREAATGAVAAMVGALILSRAVGDLPLAQELLDSARALIDETFDG